MRTIKILGLTLLGLFIAFVVFMVIAANALSANAKLTGGQDAAFTMAVVGGSMALGWLYLRWARSVL